MVRSRAERLRSGANGWLYPIRLRAGASGIDTGNAVREPFLTSIPNEPGTYILLLEAGSRRRVAVGALGVLDLQPGFYVYVGSALGPGGLRGRLCHHSRHSRSPHWHIDYLRPTTVLREIWFSVGASRREHLWAAALARSARTAIPLTGFGASDCGCPAHLFRFLQRPSLAGIRRRLEVSEPESTVRRCGVAGSPRAGRYHEKS